MTKYVASFLLLCASSAFASTGTHWSYEDPAGWGKLDSEYSLCSTGKNQSPIDITHTLSAETPKLKLDYANHGTEVINNGHTIQVNVQAGSTLTLQGHTYTLKQFHFHAPSENIIDGKSYPLEAHLVHADDKGNLAVVGVMFTTGKANKALTEAWAAMPNTADSKNALTTPINARELLPRQRSYYRFNGSLTTPPCSEGVTWLVMKHPMTASQAQIDQFTKVMGHPNNRPVQPINARPVLR